jgi:predicted DsbA family dithiol-disulfide isomerase
MAYDFTGIVREYEKERGKIRGHVMESIKRGEKVSEKLWERIEEHNKNVQDDILLLDYTKELEISLKEQKRLFDSLEITTDKVNRWAKEARKEEKLKK